jgi:arabinose-5-phosphate isomerase
MWLDASVAEAATSASGEIGAIGAAHDLAPTASTTVMLALGDALALEISRRRGFAAADFAELHPGGRLGRRLARVKTLMHSGEAMPRVSADTVMTQVIHEMSHKRLGMTTVVGAPSGSGVAKLEGVISDGDLRRLLERDGPNALAHTAGEIMHRTPTTIAPEAFVGEALAVMEERKITSLVVTGAEGEALGVVHLHDLWESGG